MANTFSSILDQESSGQVDRPKPLPAGTYHCVVQGLPRFDKSSKKGTPFVEFTLKPTGAYDDVDAEALADMGGIGNRTIRHTFYLTDDAKWRLEEFLDHLGLLQSGVKYAAMIDQTPNQEVLVNLRHEASEDGTAVFARVAKTAPAE